MKRQFLPIARYPIYNEEVNKLMIESNILNGGSSGVPSAYTILWDRNNTLDELFKIEGDANGKYISEETTSPCLKSQVQKLLDQIDSKFISYKESRIKQGYESPTEMPESLQTEFYRLRARMTVLDAESEELKKRLKSFDEPKKQEEDDKVLMFGPLGAGKLQDGILVRIDGQKVTESKDGIMIINDQRSPYSGMSVVHYRRLCREYQENKDRSGKYVKALRRVSRERLPKWPVWAINYATL